MVWGRGEAHDARDTLKTFIGMCFLSMPVSALVHKLPCIWLKFCFAKRILFTQVTTCIIYPIHANKQMTIRCVYPPYIHFFDDIIRRYQPKIGIKGECDGTASRYLLYILHPHQITWMFGILTHPNYVYSNFSTEWMLIELLSFISLRAATIGIETNAGVSFGSSEANNINAFDISTEIKGTSIDF